MNYVRYQKSVQKIKFYSTDYTPQTKFEAIIPKNVGGDGFQVKIHASKQIQDISHYNFLHVAPMVMILVCLEGQCREFSKYLYFYPILT